MDKVLTPLTIGIGACLFLLDVVGVALMRLRRSLRKRTQRVFAAVKPWWVLGTLIVSIGLVIAIQAIIALNQAHLLPRSTKQKNGGNTL